MKVVFIITALTTGGAEIMLLKLLQNINRSQFNPEVISLREKSEIGARIEELGIPVHAISMNPRTINLLKFIKLLKLLYRLKPDVVHTWMYHADLLGGLAARIVGVKCIAWCIHHSDLSINKNKKQTLWMVYFCAFLSRWIPHAILSCSEKAISIHNEVGYCFNKMHLIPNGFDLSSYVPSMLARDSVRSELGIDSSALLVGLIARDHPQKNLPGFIEVADIVSRELPNVHFLLAGRDVTHANSNLSRLCHATEIAAKFHLLGRREDIPRLMASLDVLASTSWGEAFPNVLGEAMACGIPCVVTNVGDCREIVGDVGYVVQSGDMSGMAEHILELLKQPKLRSDLGRRARLRVQELYDIKKISRKYEQFYIDLVGNF